MDFNTNKGLHDAVNTSACKLTKATAVKNQKWVLFYVKGQVTRPMCQGYIEIGYLPRKRSNPSFDEKEQTLETLKSFEKQLIELFPNYLKTSHSLLFDYFPGGDSIMLRLPNIESVSFKLQKILSKSA